MFGASLWIDGDNRFVGSFRTCWFNCSAQAALAVRNSAAARSTTPTIARGNQHRGQRPSTSAALSAPRRGRHRRRGRCPATVRCRLPKSRVPGQTTALAISVARGVSRGGILGQHRHRVGVPSEKLRLASRQWRCRGQGRQHGSRRSAAVAGAGDRPRAPLPGKWIAMSPPLLT